MKEVKVWRHWPWLWGVNYGFAMACWSFFHAGGGHGTYVPMEVISSPLGLLGIPPAMLGSPAFWGVVAFLLGRVETVGCRRAFLTLMGAQYVGILLILNTEEFGDWEHFFEMWQFTASLITAGFLMYTAGQIVIWIAYFSAMRSVRSAGSG